MSAHQDLKSEEMDSDVVAGSVLASSFKLKQKDLSHSGVVRSLVSEVHKLHGSSLKIVSIVGGAASGKSDMADALKKALIKAGILSDSISTDDFCRRDRKWRKLNFESDNAPNPLGKYDFEAMNKKIEEIKNLENGQTVQVPQYDEHTGLAVDAKDYPHKIGKLDVLVVQGDFHPTKDPDLVGYLHLPDQQRLQNRKRRDVGLREATEQDVIDIFNYRQKSQHFSHTLPHIENADIVMKAAITSSGLWKYDIYERTI